MIRIDGKRFDNYDTAIAFLQEEKKLQKQRENMLTNHIARQIVEKNLHAIKVCVTGGHDYIVCTLTTRNGAHLYPMAMVESMFGYEYSITESGGLMINYETKDVSDKEELAIKNYLAQHVSDFCAQERTIIKGKSIDDEVFDIVIGNYLYRDDQQILMNSCKKRDTMESLLDEVCEEFGV